MSAATKKKHVAKEVLDEFVVPEPHQRIVQVVAGKGNNLHQVFDPAVVNDGDEGKYLASMPTKFRKSVWIKRGDYVIVEPIEEGDKVSFSWHALFFWHCSLECNCTTTLVTQIL